MRDFLDNLIERHSVAAPQINPRLPSMFEPDISHGGWDIAAPEVEKTDSPVSTQVSIPTAYPTAIDSVRPKAASAPTIPFREEKPPVQAGQNEYVSFRSSQETAKEGGINSTSALLTLTRSQRERGFDEVVDRTRYAHQQGRSEHTSPNPQAKTEKQTSGTERVPVFSRTILGVPTIPSPSQRSGEEGVRGRSHGLLNPSIIPSAPVISSRPEQPIPKPEPIINVTIGRVEVRATPPSTQQVKKPRSTPPVMTLDEYLQKRSKGDRQ